MWAEETVGGGLELGPFGTFLGRTLDSRIAGARAGIKQIVELIALCIAFADEGQSQPPIHSVNASARDDPNADPPSGAAPGPGLPSARNLHIRRDAHVPS